MAAYPDVVTLKTITGSVTAAAVAAGGSSKVTVTLDDVYVIIGVPKVTTPTINADVKLVSGGKNEFTVEAINNDAAAQDVVVNYEVTVIRSV